MAAGQVFEASKGRMGYSDDDWNLKFYDNCGMPKNSSVQWIEEGKNKFLRFQLDNKHYGECASDRKIRHNAPYWERAELKQISSLTRNAKYQLEFQVRFLEGFSGNRESFWQIHSCAGQSCCRPPVMIKFSEGKLGLSAMDRAGRKSSTYISNVKIEDLIGRWSIFVLEFQTTDTANISLSLNGNNIFSDIPFVIPKCGNPHLKFGIYRPGNAYGNNTAIIDFDEITLNNLQ